MNCKFVSESKVTKLNPVRPEVKTTKIDKEFLIFVDQDKNEASYINITFKVKSPLIISVSRSEIITFLEKDVTDNHFSLSVFQSGSGDGTLPAVMYSHAWNAKVDFYAPTIVLGGCRKIG